MRFNFSMIMLALLVLSFAPGCSEADGTAQYCSVTDAAGAWDFAWMGEEPCRPILGRTVPGGTIQKAGSYSLRGENRVELRCAGGYASSHRGVGTLAMSYARSVVARRQGLAGCVFTVAPEELASLDEPLALDSVQLVAGRMPETVFEISRYP